MSQPSHDSGYGTHSIVDVSANKETNEYNSGTATSAVDSGDLLPNDVGAGVHPKIAPANQLWSTDPLEPVQLHTKGANTLTIHDLFTKILEKYGNELALRTTGLNTKIWSYSLYYDTSRRAARSIIHLGVEPGMGVGIIGFNAPHWLFANIGAIFAGGISVGFYTTNNEVTCQFIAKDSRTRLIFVDSGVQLKKILAIRNNLPQLNAIIIWDKSYDVSMETSGVFTWDTFIGLSEYVDDETLNKRIANLRVNMCCSIIYTSGITGNPKGVMLSHDNITWTVNAFISEFGILNDAQYTVVSYLPLSHIAAQMLDIYIPLSVAGIVVFAQPDALKQSLEETLREARPTLFMGVPHVWEKIMGVMLAKGAQVSGLKQQVAKRAKTIGLHCNKDKLAGKHPPMKFRVVEKLIFHKNRYNMGLDRCRLFMSGAAPISRDVMEYFLSINIPINEIYGMSESTGPHFKSQFPDTPLGSCGQTFQGADTTLHVGPEGNELWLKGRNIFMGYIGQSEKTKEVLDEEGWLHTGDLGRVDENQFYYITGRIKELIITAGGENIPPVIIEETIKDHLPCISNVCVIGDERKYLTCLLTFKVEVDEEGGPSDVLTMQVKRWCQELGSHAKTVDDVRSGRDIKVNRAIAKGLFITNKWASSQAHKVQKYRVLACDFSVEGGELSPTLKLKRHFIHTKYIAVIESMYSEDDFTSET